MTKIASLLLGALLLTSATSLIAATETASGSATPAPAPLSETALKGAKAAAAWITDYATKEWQGSSSSAANVPLPDKMTKLESALKAANQSALVADFKQKLSQVAAESFPKASAAFKSTSQTTSYDGAGAALKAGPDGLTNYLKQQSRAKIVEQVLPLVTNSSKAAGLASAYQAMVAKAGPLASMFGKQPPVNLEQYVTDNVVDQVFGLMAKGEGVLRANPALAKNPAVQQALSGATPTR